jgi:acylphosphatase
MPTIHLTVKGKVQGVFYRATAKDVAEGMHITGWVKNTDDGDVEIVATGSKDQLEKLVEWCKKGPSKAIVTNVIVENKEEEHFKNFQVIRR